MNSWSKHTAYLFTARELKSYVAKTDQDQTLEDIIPLKRGIFICFQILIGESW